MKLYCNIKPSNNSNKIIYIWKAAVFNQNTHFYIYAVIEGIILL